MPLWLAEPDETGFAPYQLDDGSVIDLPYAEFADTQLSRPEALTDPSGQAGQPDYSLGQPALDRPAAPWELPVPGSDSIDSALATADQPVVENNTPVPDELLADSPVPSAPAVEPTPVAAAPQAAPSPPGRTSRYGLPSVPTTEDYASSLAPGFAQQSSGLQRSAQAQSAVDTLEGKYAQQQRDVELDSLARAHKIQKDREIAVNASNAKIAAAEAAIKDINPNQAWESRSDFQKAAGIIGAAIAGWLNPGGKNGMIDLMMQIADQDIAAQQANQGNARAKVGIAQGERAETYNRFGQMMQDVDIQRAARIRALISANTAEASKYKSEFTKAKFEQLNGELMVRYGDALNTARDKEFNNVLGIRQAEERIASERAQRAAAASQRRAADEQARMLKSAKQAEELQKLQDADLKRVRGGLSEEEYNRRLIRNPNTNEVVGLARQASESQIQDIGIKNAAVLSSAKKLNRLKTMGKELGGVWNNWTNVPDGDPRKAEYLAEYEDYLSDLVLAKTGATATPEQLEAYRKILPIEKAYGPGAAPALNRLADKILDERDRELRATVEGVDATGSKLNWSVKGAFKEIAEPEGDTTRPKTASQIIDTLAKHNPSDEAIGKDSKRAIEADAQKLISNLDGLNPGQVGNAYAVMMNNAAKATTAGEKKAWLDRATKIEAHFRVREASHKAYKSSDIANDPNFVWGTPTPDWLDVSDPSLQLEQIERHKPRQSTVDPREAAFRAFLERK